MATKKRDAQHDDEPGAPTSGAPTSNPRNARGSDTVPRSSAPPPALVARWGRVRDGLAAIGNVEAVLRSAHPLPLATDVLDELRRGLSWLHEAFAAAESESQGDDQRAARTALRSFAERRVATVEAMLQRLDTASRDVARETLASAGADLDAAAGLLELAERAAIAAAVELSIASLAEQSLQVTWSIRARPVGVHVRPAEGDCSVWCDPHVVARLLAIGVALVHEVSSDVVVRTHVDGQAGVIEVASYAADQDQPSHVMQTRLVPHVEPTEIIVRAAAAAAGLEIQIEPGRVLLRCPRVG